MSPAEATRRNVALRTMRQFAASRGFTLGEVREVDSGPEIDLISAAPDGKEFRVGYAKDCDEPTA